MKVYCVLCAACCVLRVLCVVCCVLCVVLRDLLHICIYKQVIILVSMWYIVLIGRLIIPAS